MEITIELTLPAFDCMTTHMPETSGIYTRCHDLRMTFRPTGQSIVELRCDEKEIEALLGIAKQYCPDAVQQIEDALIKSS